MAKQPNPKESAEENKETEQAQAQAQAQAKPEREVRARHRIVIGSPDGTRVVYKPGALLKGVSKKIIATLGSGAVEIEGK